MIRNPKWFVIGVETKKDTVTGKSNGGVKEGDATATMIVTPTKVESHVDFEDGDEVIVFKLTVIDNRTEMLAQKRAIKKGCSIIGQPYQFQFPMRSNNSQVAVSIAGELKDLTLMESRHVGNHGMHRDIQDVQFLRLNASDTGILYD
ncbi:hypothetical protein Tco_0010741 [Tanacetum coccineum]